LTEANRQGSIDFESVMGEGTTFIIRLPHQEKASLAEVAAPRTSRARDEA